MNEIIKLKQITKCFENNKLFENLDMTFNEGEMTAITGQSGCGKSTLLNIIGLLEKPDNGYVEINGKEIKKYAPKIIRKILSKEITYLFQNYALIDNETVEYNLLIALKFTKLTKKEKQKNIIETLKKLGLDGLEKRKIYTLSGGQQQRVAIGRAILKPSNIILADEPTGSLDEENKWIIFNLLLELNEQGKTVIMVTHDHELVEKCSRIINL